MGSLYLTLAFIVGAWSAGYLVLKVVSRAVNISIADYAGAVRRPWYLWSFPFRAVMCDTVAKIEQLKQSEFDHKTRYRIVTENVAAAVMLHQPDGTILWCSPYTEVLTGFAVSEVYDQRTRFLRDHVHEEDREVFEKSLAIVATGEPFQCRYRFYHRSGITLWLETRTVPVFDHVADEYVALSVTLDVTAAVLSQMKIEERNRDLNEFTYMISHDLKAPIVTIRGMLEVLDEERKRMNAAGMEEPVAFMSKAIHRLEQLVQGVLELARVSAAERALEPVSLEDTVREVVEDFQLEIARADATVTTVSELPWVLGNKMQIYQIVSNVVSNAIKYRNPERPLVIAIEPAQSASRRRASFVIRDNGRGIASDKIARIFEPFNRGGEDSIEGSGVGLACVKRIIEKIGGSISVDSAPDSGSRFTIELRRAPGR